MLPNMAKSYTPGPEADAIVSRHVKSGQFENPDDVVFAGLRLLDEQEAELAVLRALVDEGDADIAAGRVMAIDDVGAFTDAILVRGAARSAQRR